MSRKKTQPKKNIIPDPKFNSTIIPKLINNIMYDGKRGVAAKIVYDAIDKIKAKSKAKFLVISGKPINEEIARGGPFVMNTKAEILQAVQDYHNGTFVK